MVKDLNDAFEVSIDIKGPIEKIVYEYEVINWTNEDILIQIDFTDPSLISKGNYNDQLNINVKNPMMFISTQGAVLDSKSKLKLVHPLRRQLPKGVKEEELQDIASSVGYGMTILAFINLGL